MVVSTEETVTVMIVMIVTVMIVTVIVMIVTVIVMIVTVIVMIVTVMDIRHNINLYCTLLPSPLYVLRIHVVCVIQ